MEKGGSANVQGIVLAGVHRWGESAFDQLLPRPLMPVAESPLICYGLRWLRDAGVRRATVCANSESRLVRRCLGDGTGLGLDIHYYEDMTPRGPAGCVRDAGLCDGAEDVIVVEGTVIPMLDLGRLLSFHRRCGAAATIVVESQAAGQAESMPRPVGIYVFARRSLEPVPLTGYQDIKELLIPRLHDRGEHVAIYPSDGDSLRITDAQTYRAANEWMVEQVACGALELPNYLRRGQACIHALARVSDDARLVGAVMIGPETAVAGGATLVGPTTLGEGCVVQPRAVVCRSVIWDRCQIGESALVDQCILASGATVRPHSRLRSALEVGDVDGLRLRRRREPRDAGGRAAAPPNEPALGGASAQHAKPSGPRAGDTT